MDNTTLKSIEKGSLVSAEEMDRVERTALFMLFAVGAIAIYSVTSVVLAIL